MYHYFTDWNRQPLGQLSDDSLAEQLGCGTSTVRKHRIKRGIPPFASTKRLTFSLDKKYFSLLGTCTDAFIAREAGIPLQYVINARRERGIPSCMVRTRSKAMQTALDLVRDYHGKMPDKTLAEQTGIPWWVLHQERLRLGIPTFIPRTTCVCGKQITDRKSPKKRFCSRDCARMVKDMKSAIDNGYREKYSKRRKKQRKHKNGGNPELDRVYFALYRLTRALHRKRGTNAQAATQEEKTGDRSRKRR